jgi:shikimate 5-dehydrogenase
LPWAERASAEWDVLVQATPLGGEGEEVLPRAALQGQAVLDAAYGEGTTPLVADARARGLTAFTGRDLLAAQAALQFALLTGRQAAVEVLRRAAGVA